MAPVVIKVAVVGPRGAGKTAYITRLCTGGFSSRYHPADAPVTSTFAESCRRPAPPLRFKLIDVPPGLAVPDHDAVIQMFDRTADVPYESLNASLTAGKPLVLCGNKVDVPGLSKISHPVQAYKNKYGELFDYYDISAKSNYNFERPLLFIARRVLNMPDLEFGPSD